MHNYVYMGCVDVKNWLEAVCSTKTGCSNSNNVIQKLIQKLLRLKLVEENSARLGQMNRRNYGANKG